jgi:NAD(P)-dependent dehydrogenase (short-subunit alcohol dehydrogenase family)
MSAADSWRAALVTGANRGLGLETPRLLLDRSLRVIMTAGTSARFSGRPTRSAPAIAPSHFAWTSAPNCFVMVWGAASMLAGP